MSDLKLVVDNKQKAALVIDAKDNVAVALEDLKMGETCLIRFEDLVEQLEVIEDIGFGHKIALKDLQQDECVYKYGEEIGRMKEPLQRGGWIHSHNMYCERGLKNG
ncbi:UxaA family hydrolase [Ammoniphilus resinae]|uniref:Altronate dehydratase n=1 Tax=Ammoniphilus resinae TaxID=861532 RepID=A0ABS4GVI6_9BACL|nr:UxaA family hydrolase [Ammoniphilus resinae]MBP1933895.1 altronate dehydratase [Ammoniphilus resinae]